MDTIKEASQNEKYAAVDFWKARLREALAHPDRPKSETPLLLLILLGLCAEALHDDAQPLNFAAAALLCGFGLHEESDDMVSRFLRAKGEA